MRYLFIVGCLLCASLCAQEPEVPAPSELIDPYVEELVAAATDWLAESKSVRFAARVTTESVLDNGHKVQLSRDVEIRLRRPDRLRADIVDDRGERVFYFDGDTATIHHLAENNFARVDTPDTVDEMLDHIAEQYDVAAPLADLLTSDPYVNFVEQTNVGVYVGLHYLDGEQVHHLSFENDAVDFQLWIASEGEPVIRKLAITYRHLDGVPQYAARLSGWKRDAISDDGLFVYTPDADALEIEYLPVADAAEVAE